MKKLLFIPILFIVFSCSPGLRIQNTYQSGEIDFNHLHNGKIAIYGVNSITLNEFKNTFKDEYSDTAKLNDKILSTFNQEFRKLIPSVTSVEENEKIPSGLTGEFSFKEDNSREISGFFNTLQTDYLIFINNISLGNTYDSYTYSTGNGIMYSGSMENCVVSMEVELWNVQQEKRLMKFRAGGEETVFLFSYLAALNGAIENSVNSAVEFLKNNGSVN
jgi:hypothetical protein